MIDKQRRRALITCTTSIVASALPLLASGQSNGFPILDHQRLSNEKLEAFDQSGKLSNIEVTVSTLGKGSAVTTIKNHSNQVVTIKSLGKGIVEHKNGQYHLNASLGKAGVTLKPGQRRILAAKRIRSDLAIA